MSKRYDMRTMWALIALALSVWTLARLVSEQPPPFGLVGFFLWWAATGAVVGGILDDARGALIGAGLGLVVGTIIIPFDIFLWRAAGLSPKP